MTHSLHRRGAEADLKNDYVLLVTAASGINHVGSKDKLRQVLEEVWQVGPTNIGSNETGTILSGVDIEEIRANLMEVPRVRCNFASKEKIRQAIERLQELDLGMSVTVSGPTQDILEMCGDYGIKPHSINFSLDIWGKKEKLPPEEALELLTMCGHSLISKTLVAETITKVRQGKMSPEKGALKVGHPCICGIYNPERAKTILERVAPSTAEVASAVEVGGEDF